MLEANSTNNAEWLITNCYHLTQRSMDWSGSGAVKCIRLSALQHLGNCRLLLTTCSYSLVLACACSFSIYWRAICCSGCCVNRCLWRLLVLYDFAVFLLLEMLPSQSSQRVLLLSAAFTEKCCQISLFARLAIDCSRKTSMLDSLDMTIQFNFTIVLIPILDTSLLHALVPVPIPIPIPVVSVEP